MAVLMEAHLDNLKVYRKAAPTESRWDEQMAARRVVKMVEKMDE